MQIFEGIKEESEGLRAGPEGIICFSYPFKFYTHPFSCTNPYNNIVMG